MSQNNQHGMHEDDHYDRFDALPPPFRRLMQYADCGMCVWPAEQAIDASGERRGLEIFKQVLWSKRRELVLEHYGPTHPQVSR